MQNLLLGTALTKAKQFADGKIICTVLTAEDFEKTGASKMDTDGIVDQLRITEGTETAVFIYQTDTDEYKVSLRSNYIVNVSAIACRHGGGGHVRASGYSIRGDIQTIVRDVVEEIQKQLI